MSQVTLAKLAGVKQPTISRLELGQRLASAALKERIDQALVEAAK